MALIKKIHRVWLQVKTGDIGNVNPTTISFENTSILPTDKIGGRSFKWRNIIKVEGGVIIEYKGDETNSLFIPDSNISGIEYSTVEIEPKEKPAQGQKKN